MHGRLKVFTDTHVRLLVFMDAQAYLQIFKDMHVRLHVFNGTHMSLHVFQGAHVGLHWQVFEMCTRAYKSSRIRMRDCDFFKDVHFNVHAHP